MNIWILNHYSVTPDMPGGTRHYDLAQELIKKGHSVTIFASSYHLQTLKELRLKPKEKYKIEDYNGVNFVWIKTFPYKRNDWKRIINMLIYSMRAYKVGKNLLKSKKIKNPDIIIGSSVHLFAALSAYNLSKSFKSKFVMEVRDLWPQALIDIGKISKWHPIVLLFSLLEFFLYKNTEKIITPLPFAHEYITLLGIEKEKIIWISNGVNLDRFDIHNKIKKQETNEFKVMYLGAHGFANSLNTILKSAKIIQTKGFTNINFSFVGDGPEKSKLINLLKEMKLKNIKLHNAVSKKEVPKIIKNSDILLFPLISSSIFKYGISSNKLFDFMASGKPIIYAAKARNNLVQEAQCGIVVPSEDPKALADALIKLYKTSAKERLKMGKRGKKYVKKYYDITILADKLESTLKDINFNIF